MLMGSHRGAHVKASVNAKAYQPSHTTQLATSKLPFHTYRLILAYSIRRRSYVNAPGAQTGRARGDRDEPVPLSDIAGIMLEATDLSH